MLAHWTSSSQLLKYLLLPCSQFLCFAPFICILLRVLSILLILSKMGFFSSFVFDPLSCHIPAIYLFFHFTNNCFLFYNLFAFLFSFLFDGLEIDLPYITRNVILPFDLLFNSAALKSQLNSTELLEKSILQRVETDSFSTAKNQAEIDGRVFAKKVCFGRISVSF